jgi:hypothetical protein
MHEIITTQWNYSSQPEAVTKVEFTITISEWIQLEKSEAWKAVVDKLEEFAGNKYKP